MVSHARGDWLSPKRGEGAAWAQWWARMHEGGLVRLPGNTFTTVMWRCFIEVSCAVLSKERGRISKGNNEAWRWKLRLLTHCCSGWNLFTLRCRACAQIVCMCHCLGTMACVFYRLFRSNDSLLAGLSVRWRQHWHEFAVAFFDCFMTRMGPCFYCWSVLGDRWELLTSYGGIDALLVRFL